jgi:endonuclease YncB( thermonuclease family)
MPQGVQGPYLVLKVVHGDTIHVSANGQKLKIRTIGLDMPEEFFKVDESSGC